MPPSLAAQELLTAENHDLRLLLQQAEIDAEALLAQAGIDAKEREAADTHHDTPRPREQSLTEAAEVRQAFFRQVDELFDHENFDPAEFVAQGAKVVVAGTEFVRAKKTGKSMTNQWCMVFTFKDGRITRWRCYEDTAGVLAILR